MSYSISVVITTYNSTKYITKTINSVLEQTLVPNEIIIVDDNSSDQTNLVNIIKEIKEKKFQKINLFLNKKNYGPGYNRNLAWNNCKTDLIAFLDDDDIWYKKKLELQLKVFKKNKNTQLVASKKKMLRHKKFKFNFRNKNTSIITFTSLIFKNFIPTSSVIVKANINERFLNQYFAEDYYLWLIILKKFKCCYFINDFLCEEFQVYKQNKLSNNTKLLNKGVQNTLNLFYTRNLFNNLLVSFAKLYYYLKMITKSVF